MKSTIPTPHLGLRQNLHQFILLVIVNAFVGAMVGLERSILPAIAEQEFHLAAKTAILSFIIVFGFVKAFTNYFAGRLSDQYGRKIVLVTGWLVALPVPFLLMWSPSWNWILFANVLLGISQGLTWSTTVIMKIDLVGSERRGLAMGFNEFAGYFAVALSALVTGYVASHYGLRPQPFYLGIIYSAVGLGLSIFLVRETHAHVKHEAKDHQASTLSQSDVFIRTSFTDRNLSSVTQAGLVNNLNDGMAWGLFPILFAAHGMGLERIGWLAAVYPAVWGVSQLITGHLSDSLGRKWLIVWGMWVQAAGIAVTVVSSQFAGFAVGGILLGVGTAMVYPTLLAAIGDVAHPTWRASAVGIYRLWRDAGYAFGAILAGFTADLFGVEFAVWLVAAITMASGIVVAVRMRETLKAKEVTQNCVERDDLKRLMDQGKVFVVDVRSYQEFDEGHIFGAIHIPVETLPNAAIRIPKDARVVTVCNKGGGRSEEAANTLRTHAWTETKWLCDGYFGWRDAGLPREQAGLATS